MLDILAVDPSIERVRAEELIAESDRIIDDSNEPGTESIGHRIRRSLQEPGVSDSDALAYFERERELFGRRSFEESRFVIDQLVTIERLRRELGLVR